MSEFQGILPFSNSQTSVSNTINEMYVNNDSGEEIPGYAPMLLKDTVTGIYRDVGKPNADSLDSFNIVFNGPSPIPIDRTGVAVASYEVLTTINGTPALGDDIGTVNGQWYLSTGQTGFKARTLVGELAYATVFRGGFIDYTITDQPTKNNSGQLLQNEFLWTGYYDLDTIVLFSGSDNRIMVSATGTNIIDITVDALANQGLSFGCYIGLKDSTTGDTYEKNIMSNRVLDVDGRFDLMTFGIMTADIPASSGITKFDQIRFGTRQFSSGNPSVYNVDVPFSRVTFDMRIVLISL